MATDLLTGKPIAEAEAADLLSYQKDFSEGKSDTDPIEKQDEVWAKSLEHEDMDGDMAWKYEQTRANSSWDIGIDIFKRAAMGILPLTAGKDILKGAVGEPGMDVLQKSVAIVPEQTHKAVLTAIHGDQGASVINKDLHFESDDLPKEVFKMYGDMQLAPYVPIKLTEIAALPQNLAFSIISMTAGLSAAAPTAAVPIPGARAIPMLLGSGMASYRMARYQIMQELLEAENEKEPLTPETERQWKAYYQSAAHRYGLWEAIPEALSNLAFVGILTGKLTKFVAKPVAKRIGARLTATFGEKAVGIGGKVAGGMFNIASMFGQEIATEAVTQMGQARIEEETGLREPGKGQITYWQAIKEVAPQTIALTMIMGGAGASTVMISKKVKESFKKETKGKPAKKVKQAEDILDEMVNDVNKQVDKNKRQEKLMADDAMKGLTGWFDAEGNYHSAMEEKPEAEEKATAEKVADPTKMSKEEWVEAQQSKEGEAANKKTAEPKKKRKTQKKQPEVIRNAISRIKKFQERLTDPDIKRRKDVESERKDVADYLNRSKLLPLYPRRRMVEAINKMQGISTEKGRERFSKLLDAVIEQIETVQKRKDLKDNISERKLKRVENLRKASKLPSIDKMSGKQLNEFTEMLAPYQEGDVFLSQRQIETVDNTDLTGIRTLREARERLAKDAGVPIEELSKIKVGVLDKFRQDVRLATKNPLYKLLVEETHGAFIQSDLAYREFERKLEDLTNKARKSKKRGILDVLIPSDELVFNYLSTENKTEIEEQMTKEELALALFLQGEYAKALQYLIEKQTLKTGIDNYITNVRRGFLEALKESGMISALKELFDAHKMDAEVFNILDQETDMILPLEKFFQFAMKRTGNINPTKNVAKASSIYFQTFHKKTALDSIVPKMMIYVQAMTPLKETPRGLEYDRSIQRFAKEWINTKKGRKSQRWIKQGGPLDIGILTLKSLISIWDLGINIPVQLAATIGETSAGYVTLGKKNFAKGVARLATKKGRSFANKHEGFTGKTLWQELYEPAKNIGDKFMTAVFGGFSASSTRMNKISLLGMVTDQEYESGEVSSDRLAEIKLEIGKMRIISGGKSIGEATTVGGMMTQYKTWALPILGTVSSDFISMAKKLKSGQMTWGAEELTRLRREAEILTAALLVFALVSADDKDRSFIGQLLKKAKREALTILGALDPEMWLGTPRMIEWIDKMGTILKQIITLEKYKTKGRQNELKGVTAAKRVLTPRAISMFMPDDSKRKPRGMM